MQSPAGVGDRRFRDPERGQPRQVVVSDATLVRMFQGSESSVRTVLPLPGEPLDALVTGHG